MIEKDINEITEQDLQFLVDNAVLEDKTLEYKQTLPNNFEADKKEFLADVSSFANASGGDLIYGIASEKGTPKPLVGLDINPDQAIQWLDNIIRTGIEPRIPSISIPPPIRLKNGRVVLIIRIPRSWASPH
ncbi:MAG: ATP-binding protein [Chloroflexi bacterium]|nr:ATP-binding protein [Chloroflexota bacterium]